MTNINCLLFFLTIFLSACASSNQSLQKPSSAEERYYTSAHPNRNISGQLEQIQHSVKRISATAIYQAYYFDGLYLRAEQLDYVDIQKLASRNVTYHRSTAGTAFIIGRGNNHVAFLSCAHVISFPDTLISYVNDGSVTENSVISSISIKKHQSNLIFDLHRFRSFEIIARDDLQDLTLLTVSLSENEDFYAPPLSIEIGDPKDLRLGSYVMVMGYPEGFPMVTDGIVSDANRNSYGAFLTDALFNHGISGGVIIASRDNYRSFEWVGVANSTSAKREMQLVPNPLTVDLYQPFEPYADEIFVQQKADIVYGITQAIPVTIVIEFLQKHEEKLARLGIDVNRIISTEY
ncbi:MAG TPA: serine protease [Balneolaceae bacterium]